MIPLPLTDLPSHPATLTPCHYQKRVLYLPANPLAHRNRDLIFHQKSLDVGKLLCSIFQVHEKLAIGDLVEKDKELIILAAK